MVKHRTVLIILVMMFFLVGCENEKTHIVQESEAWDYTDVKIEGIPEKAFVCAMASNGIYYEIENSVDYSGAEPTVENEYHFLDYSGNDRLLLRKSDMNTYNIINTGDCMLLCNPTGDGMEILKLSPEGEVETLFNQKAPQFPFIQTYEDYMVSIRNNFVEGSDMYENLLILQDMKHNEERVIYRTLWNNEEAEGEDLGCVSINDEMVCFTLNRHYKNKEDEYILFLYNINEGKIVEEILLPTRVYYAAYGGKRAGLLLSETDDQTYMEEAGVIGNIKGDAFVENAKIPLISASNMIRKGKFTGDGYYFTTYNAAYYWEIEENKVYVYDYQWMGNCQSVIEPTENGLRYVVSDEDGIFIRTMSVK